MSTYFNNIPQPDDDPTDSQPQLLSNFQAILNAQNRNHVDFNDLANSGRHEVIELKEQASNPTPIIGFGDLFVRDDSGTQNLFFLDDTDKEFQLTNNFEDDDIGFIIFPGGLQFKWGKATATQESTQLIEYDTADFGTRTLNVQITVNKIDTTGRSVMVDQNIPPTISGFNAVNNNNNNDIEFFWLAIGI